MKPFSRRRLFQIAGVSAAGAFANACAPVVLAPAPLTSTLPATMLTPEPPITNAEEALARLMRGNQRYVAALSVSPNRTIERREQVAGGQMPFAIVLGCSDSRVTPGLVFDQGIGDLFVIRLAGNLFDDNAGVGSIEYAVHEFNCPLLLVLGHDKCGAVEATIESIEHQTTLPGKLDSIVQAIRPAVEEVQGKPGDLLDNAINANVLHVVAQLKNADPFISKAQADGKLKIIGARYGLKTGAVELFSS